MTRSERWRATYLARIAAGNCRRCNAPAPGTPMCESCYAKRTATDKARRAKRRAAGLCAHCPKKAEAGRSRCAACAVKRREYQRIYDCKKRV